MNRKEFENALSGIHAATKPYHTEKYLLRWGQAIEELLREIDILQWRR